jgi:diguanylate cyclase (GGDEF)-like protein
MIWGGVCFLLTSLTDITFVPDIGFQGVLLRLGAFPLFFLVLAFGPNMAPMQRERLVTAAGTVLVVLLGVIPLLSSAPQASLSFMCAIFAVAFGNTTVVPRFRHACIFTAISCIAIGALAIWQGPHGWAIAIELVLVAAFSLFANYRIERGDRLEYLLARREAMLLAALRADREKLKALSETDALTGIANRCAFNDYCTRLFADQRYLGRQIAVLLADVDFFKAYNDAYGHLAGDGCLRAVARSIAATLRNADDIVARYGGVEFVACVLDATPAQARLVAKRVCDGVLALRIPHTARPDDICHVSLSVGIATAIITPDADIDGLIAAADKALYSAKHQGRNRVEFAHVTAA